MFSSLLVVVQGEVVLIQYAYPVRSWGRSDAAALASRLQRQVEEVNAKYSALGGLCFIRSTKVVLRDLLIHLINGLV